MRYYIFRSLFTQPKNKAQAHIQDFIKRYDRMLVNCDEDLNQIIARIEREVKKVNSLYPRCKPLKLDVQNYKNSDSVGICIYVDIDSSFAYLTANKIYKEYLQGFIQNCLL